MPKLRVYQLARELNRDNAEIIRELQHMGVPVTSHSNTVEDRLADRLRRELGVFAPAEAKAAPLEEEVVEAATLEVPAPPETPQPEPAPSVHIEPERPHIEAKAEPKVEEKAPAPPPAAKVVAPPAPPPPPAPPAAAAPPAPPATHPPASPRVEPPR